MAIKIVFYTFSKRTNSTKQPTGGLEINCDIWGDCSIISPDIRVKMQNPTAFNYARIDDFNRYYFINNWRWDQGIWIASLNVDPLASWKDYIAESSHYVTRSAYESDGSITDTIYPATTVVKNKLTEYQNALAGNLGTDGEFVLGVTNNDNAALTGGTAYYVLSKEQFAALRNYLLTSDDYLQIQEVSHELSKALFNPFQYIVSCKWFPMGVLTKGAAVTKIPFGWWEADGVGGYRLNDNMGIFSNIPIQMSNHPQAAARGDYMNGGPYTERELWFPPFGMIPLDSTRLLQYASLVVGGAIDYITGTCQFWLSGNNLSTGAVDFIETHTATVSVDIPLSTIITDANMVGDITQIGGNAIKLVGGMSYGITRGLLDSMQTGGLVNTLKAFTNGIGSGMAAAYSKPAGGGAPGTFMASEYTPGIRLFEHFWICVDDDNTQYGRPLCKIRKLGNLSGFVQCGDSDISIPCTEHETNAIKSALTGGFFME